MTMRIGKNKPFKTVLDFKYGFGAMGYYKDHGNYTAVITPIGVLAPTRLTFGGKNGPAKMQRICDHLFADIDSVCVYINEILVTTETFEEHLSVLEKVFEKIREAQFRVSVKKANFC